MKTINGTGPWNMPELCRTPEIQWDVVEEYPTYTLKRLFYANEPLQEKPTRVFAYYAVPKNVNRPLPSIVLVHGGAGKAFPEWASQWAERGYAAIAMDLFGCGPDGQKMNDGGPHQTNEEVFFHLSTETITEMWTYHAVAAVIRGLSILLDQPEIDRGKIGMMGISWGGYLAEIVSGIDHRINYVITVYAAGYFDEGSQWMELMEEMEPSQRRLWNDNFDIKQYISQTKIPMLWATGTNDSSFHLGNWQKTYRSTKGTNTLRLIKDWEHGYYAPWAAEEFFVYADSQTRNNAPLTIVKSVGLHAGMAWATFDGVRNLCAASLLYTLDEGPWPMRRWESQPAELDLAEGRVTAVLPPSAKAYCFTLEDEDGYVVSTDLIIE